jgi:hypothetical protein
LAPMARCYACSPRRSTAAYNHHLLWRKRTKSTKRLRPASLQSIRRPRSTRCLHARSEWRQRTRLSMCNERWYE